MPAPVLRPLAAILVRHILRAYACVAMLVIAVQAGWLYQDRQAAARHELQTLAGALAPDVSWALQHAQHATLQSVADGALENELVRSIRIGDDQRPIQAYASRQRGDEDAGRPVVHRELFAQDEHGNYMQTGYMDITLDEDVILSRLFASSAWLLLGALVLAAALYLIVASAVRRLLATPLETLTLAMEGTHSVGDSVVHAPDTSHEFARLHDALAALRERARQIDQLQADKLAAETRSAEQSRFLANASHDLRQPLHALSLYLGALSRNDMPAGAAAVVGKAQQCAAVVDNMFRSILDVSRLDAGMAQVQIAPFRIQNILDTVQIQFEPSARSKGIALRIVGTELMALSDQALVGRIVHNLVSNAVRYTTRGGVLVGCRRAGRFIRIEVHDTGPGIADATRRSIFAEYTRGPHESGAESPSDQGLGLGLAIAQRLAIVLGLSLALRSTPGRGTAFSLQLPVATSDQAPLRPAAPDETNAQSPRCVAGKLVLIVDDEPSILDATATLVESWGGIPVTAASYDEAIALAETPDFVPDAILCDFQLSGDISGDALIRRVRQIVAQPVPALLVTGTRIPEHGQPLSAHVLYKPLAEETLRMALDAVLARGQPQTGDAGVDDRLVSPPA